MSCLQASIVRRTDRRCFQVFRALAAFAALAKVLAKRSGTPKSLIAFVEKGPLSLYLPFAKASIPECQ